MRFKTLFAVCALFGSLFQSSPSLSETLRTAWLGEHEAFLTWYAKEKGWDKEAGLDIIMLRFDSGKSLIENVRAYDWAIAGCGAVPAMQATMSDQVEVIAIANDESSANMILTRPDSPILAEKGFNPDFPNVFGTPESVKGKLILCPKKTSARYLLDKWLAALGLEDDAAVFVIDTHRAEVAVLRVIDGLVVDSGRTRVLPELGHELHDLLLLATGDGCEGLQEAIAQCDLDRIAHRLSLFLAKQRQQCRHPVRRMYAEQRPARYLR